MAELFEPAIGQLARLSEEGYDTITQVTLARITEIEDDADLPDPDDQDAVANEIEEQRMALERGIESFTEELIEGDTIESWEEKLAESVSSALLLALLIGFGGSEPIRQQSESRTIIGMIVDLIRGQRRAIKNNADVIGDGNMTTGKLRDIPRRRSLSFKSGYETSRIANNMFSRFHNEGVRSLGVAHHCPDCPLYERLDWVPINEIIPIATFCVCQSNCKCSVITRFNPARVIQDLQGGSLFNQVSRRREFMQQAEQDYLRRHDWL